MLEGESIQIRGQVVPAGTKPREMLFGVFYVLYPESRIEADTVEDLKVEPLRKTVEFCKKHIYTYEPALEMLEKVRQRKKKKAPSAEVLKEEAPYIQ